MRRGRSRSSNSGFRRLIELIVSPCYLALSSLAFLVMEALAALIRLEVHGREHIPRGGYVLCPTHRGELDPYFVRRALRDRLVLPKRNRFIFRLEFGPLVRKLFLAHWGGWIVSEREPRLSALALRGALRWLEGGRPVTIFPEGHRHGQGVVHEGAALLACRSGRPLLPLLIDRGVFVGEGIPFYLFPVVTLGRYLRECPHVRLTFLEPLHPELERYRREGRRYVRELTERLGELLLGTRPEVRARGS